MNLFLLPQFLRFCVEIQFLVARDTVTRCRDKAFGKGGEMKWKKLDLFATRAKTGPKTGETGAIANSEGAQNRNLWRGQLKKRPLSGDDRSAASCRTRHKYRKDYTELPKMG